MKQVAPQGAFTLRSGWRVYVFKHTNLGVVVSIENGRWFAPDSNLAGIELCALFRIMFDVDDEEVGRAFVDWWRFGGRFRPGHRDHAASTDPRQFSIPLQDAPTSMLKKRGPAVEAKRG